MESYSNRSTAGHLLVLKMDGNASESLNSTSTSEDFGTPASMPVEVKAFLVSTFGTASELSCIKIFVLQPGS